jgi:hypothetical protein
MIRLLPLLGVEPSGNEIVLFFFITLVLIAGSLLVVRFVKEGALIILGLLVAAAAMGYGLLGGLPDAPNAGTALSPLVAPLAGTLMKVAVILVLAGVARSLLAACCGEAASNSPKPL